MLHHFLVDGLDQNAAIRPLSDFGTAPGQLRLNCDESVEGGPYSLDDFRVQRGRARVPQLNKSD